MKPSELNFKVPGRFEDHSCTFVTWPCKGDKEINLFRKEIASVIKIISKYEKVILIVDPEDLDSAQVQCSDFADMWPIPTDMSWIRDNGPIFTKKENDEIVAINFEFNGWGNKFYPYDKVKNIQGLNISIVTTGKTDEEAYELLIALGLPIRKKKKNKNEEAEV